MAGRNKNTINAGIETGGWIDPEKVVALIRGALRSSGRILSVGSEQVLRTSEWLFILGTWFFVYRIDIGIAKPTEYVYGLAILSGAVFFLTMNRVKRLDGTICVAVGIALLSVFVATALSAFTHGIYFNRGGTRLILKLILNVLTLFVLLNMLKGSRDFYGRMARALFVPFVFYGVAPFLPWEAKSLLVDTAVPGEGRFLGLSNAVGSMAFPLVEAFGFCYIGWLDLYRRTQIRHYGYLLCLISLTLLGLWSASRICMIAMGVCVLVGGLLLRTESQRAVPFSGALTFGVSLLVVLTVAGHLGYDDIILVAKRRVFGPAVGDLPGYSAVDKLKLSVKLISEPEYNVRLLSFPYYGRLALENPLGLGVNYFDRFAANIGGEQLPPDSFLDTFIHGGFILFVSMAYLVARAFWNIIGKIRERSFAEGGRNDLQIYMVGAATGLVANVVFTVFGGFPIYSMRFWIILSMCLI